MPSNLVKLTFQAVLLSCLSNVLAQIIGCYKAQKSLTLDLVSLFQFVLFTVISCPPNILWQQFLEDRFPAYTFRKAPKVKADDDQVKSGEMGLDVPNTCKKFALDQTIGAAFNTVMFIVAIGLLKGKDLGTVTGDCQRDFWPITKSGMKLWPLVSILCFTVVPLDHRVLVGSLFGVVWNIYLSLMAAD